MWFWRKWSLRAVALDQLALARRQRLRMLLRRRRHPWTQISLFLLALGVLFLPIPTKFGPYAESKASTSFLNQQWLVVAAVLGLAVAVVGIVMTAFLASSRNAADLSVREFAMGVGYTNILYVGVAAILVNGMALFPLGTNAPAGWPAFWSTLVSIAAVVGVLVVFERGLDALDPRRLAIARTRRLVRETAAVVDTQLVRVSAETWLQQQPDSRLKRRLTPPEASQVLRTQHAGRIRDIRIRKLTKLADGLANTGTITLLGEDVLERQVDRDTPLVAVPASATAVLGSVRRTFRIARRSPPADQVLIATLEGLHTQAMQAVRVGDLTQWRSISQGYRDVLLAFPRARAESGLDISLDQLIAPSLLPTGPVDRITAWLVDEVRAALASGHADVLLAISSFPLSVARAASQLAAASIVQRMLNLYPLLYQLGAGP